nr:hypothetical protein [Enterococcus gallinarum]
MVAEGDDAECTAPIGYIGEPGEQVSGEASPAEPTSAPVEENKATSEEPKAQAAPERKAGERIFITPLARKLAAEKGFDIAKLMAQVAMVELLDAMYSVINQSVETTIAAASSTVGAGFKRYA